MQSINPSMRLKVKADTFFLPGLNGSVYFRNNENSFRMEGTNIDQWIERLIPAFDGQSTLGDLTAGLPDQYLEQVFDIAKVLYKNGFVRDVSQDCAHQLSNEILTRYASQIEFLDNIGGSGAHRFQTYRKATVLAVGSGEFFVSLVRSLLESGKQKVQMLITDSEPTSRQRLKKLEAHALKTDPEVTVEEITLLEDGVSSWREAVHPFDAVVYVSQNGDVEELRDLHQVCREEKKVLLPAMCVKQVGMAGPLVHPDSDACWESAWRRIHESAVCKDRQLHVFSSTAGAMLANVIVFELLKTVTGVTESDLMNKLFLLDLETLEGRWHSFLPHPLVVGHAEPEWVQDVDLWLERMIDIGNTGDLPLYFSLLTSPEVGIFHIWGEGDLKQLPLAQCGVQVADPLSEGPAELLPYVTCTGLTHEEARREAGLAGIEMYMSRMVTLLTPPHDEVDGSVLSQEFVGVGAGETIAEGICRALQQCLIEDLRTQNKAKQPHVSKIQSNEIEDDYCRFYLQALTIMQGFPEIGLGQQVSGFPVVWVGTNGRWYGGVGLNLTLALRNVLQQALFMVSNDSAYSPTPVLEVPSVLLNDMTTHSVVVPFSADSSHTELLQSAIKVLKENRKRMVLLELAWEPFLDVALIGVFGVSVREEASR